MKWTPAQLDAIRTTGRSLLVSAAAGSGKTAVLAERCAHLVCDAADACDVGELLVVTFTRPAAAEMRDRIERTLRKRLEQSDDPRLQRQLMLLDRAQINTLHGFCTTVLRQYFHVLGLDPNFRVLDEEEVRLLRYDLARQMLDDRYESDTAGAFQRFVDTHGNGNDQIILDRVLSLHDLLGSVVDREGWLDAATRRIAEAARAKPLVRSELGKSLADSTMQWLDDLKLRWLQLAERIARIDGLDRYGEHVNELLATVISWRDDFADGDFDALSRAVKAFAAPKLPTIKNPPPQKETIQKQIDELKKEMKESAICTSCRFTEAQWRDGLSGTLPAVEVLVDLVRDFERRFDRAKRELRGLDFTDLERFTLRILRQSNEGSDLSPSAVARAYHKQFKHVLVDEYQDINEVQDAILRLISRECIRGEKDSAGNLFSVGDVKQSIYRFRLAQPNRFLNRYQTFRKQDGNGQVIDLSSNFRSRGPLLEVINGVFERLMSQAAVEIEYDQSHRLVAGASYPPSDGRASFVGSPVELHLLPPPPRGGTSEEDSAADQDLDRTEREAVFITSRVQQLMASGMHVADKSADGSLSLRPLQYRDIVILLRSMKHKSEQFVRLLRGAGIPVHSDAGTGFFDSMEIRDMIALLKVMDNQQQDIPLAAVLRSPLSGLADVEDCLARIRIQYSDAQQIPFHAAVRKYAREVDDELAAHLRAFLRQLREWRRQAHQRPLAEVLWRVYDETGYLAFAAGMNDGEQRVANLIDFHERARQFGTFQRQGLARFMQFLDSLAEQTDLGQPSVASEADDVVRVMSIHRSKGLEFPVVFVPDLGKKHNLQDTSGAMLVDRDAGIGLMVPDEARRVRYPSLAHVVVQDRIRRQSLAEELRVLYVAMTRAREHLILVGTCEEKHCEQWQQQWSSHRGAFPAQRVLSGRSMLDWIGPAAAAMQGAGARHGIELTWHSEEEIATWSASTPRRPSLSPEQMKLAMLEPLSPAPAMDPQAQRVRDRLTRKYPHEMFAKLPAVQSVGQLTKQRRSAPAGYGSAGAAADFEPELAIPRCCSQEIRPSATEVGSATHVVLEHLDFSRPCDESDINRQIANLIERKQLSADHAPFVDVSAICWLMSTSLGAILRRCAGSLRRELPIYYAMPLPGSADPMDQMMVRGRIDMLAIEPDGLVLVDFKTDRVTEKTVDARAEFYRPQITSYRDAVSGIAAQPVKLAALVFLAPRIIKEM